MVGIGEVDERVTQAKPGHEALWWDSFVLLIEQLENASISQEVLPSLVKRLKSNHSWFLDSVNRFNSPSAKSRAALDSSEISFGQASLKIKPELKEATIHFSSLLCLDEVQTYILVHRCTELGSPPSDYKQPEFLHSVSIQYYLERQCLLKCIRWIFMHTLQSEDIPRETGGVQREALLLVQDGLENKLLSILKILLFPVNFHRTEIDLMAFWVEEILIECNLVLDILFLIYYENFTRCNGELWLNLCKLFKETISGSFNVGKLAASAEARNSFSRARVQLLFILIETLNLENLLKMVHDDIPFRDAKIFLLEDIQNMDAAVSSLLSFETTETGPLILAWAVFLYLLSSLHGSHESHVLMGIDQMSYIQNVVSCAPLGYLLESLHHDLFVDSDGPASGYQSVLKTLISAFIASFEIVNQSETWKMIIEILCKIYRGEESLCTQFWDRNSFVDKPIRSLLYSLENEFPVNIAHFVRLLSSLCEGSWPAECGFNFLCSMDCIASLFCDTSHELNVNDVVVAPRLLHVEGFETITIPKGAQGRVLRRIDDHLVLVQWKCSYSGVLVLLLHLAASDSNSYKDVYNTLDLLYRLVSFDKKSCLAFVGSDQLYILQPALSHADMQRNEKIDLVKIICSLITELVRGSNNMELVSLCINILVEIMKSLPSHVVDVSLRANIFGLNYDNTLSGLRLPLGSLAKVVLADIEQNVESCSLTMSVLEFTKQLVEVGADNDMVSSLVVFSLQYVLVSHENWIHKLRHARWMITQKVLEVVKSCIKAARDSSKLSSLIGEILFCDSSIHNVLFRVLYINCYMLQSLSGPFCDLRETEGLQFVVSLALDICFAMLKDLAKFLDTSSAVPVFIQSVLSSTCRPVSVITATSSLISFSQNAAIQVAAARLLSLLCFISSKVQAYSSENAFSVLDDKQVKHLSASICEILVGEETRLQDLMISMVDLLISAAHFQPAFLVSIMSFTDNVEPSSNNAVDMEHKIDKTCKLPPSDTKVTSLKDIIMQFIHKSDHLYGRSPRLLLGVLSLLKALWDRNTQYMQILEMFSCSEGFWKNMSSPVEDLKDKCGFPDENANDNQMLCSGYRYQCEAAILEIIAHDIFLQKRILSNEIAEKQVTKPCNGKNVTSTEMPKSGASYSKNILPKWCESVALLSHIKSYSCSICTEESFHRAKIETVLFVVHMMVKLATGNAGSFSLSLVRKILTASKKLAEQPAFLALVQQYSIRCYSEENKVRSLVLCDIYHHIVGELNGRKIAPGHFREILHYLLEMDVFQYYECNNDRYIWSTVNDICIFDIGRLRNDLGIEFWEHPAWQTSKPVAERMISAMQHTYLVKFVTHSKSSALKALASLLSVSAGYVDEAQPTLFCQGLSEPLLKSGIEHLSQCLETAKASLTAAVCPTEGSLKSITIQAELLLNLSRSLICCRHSTNAAQFLPVSLMLIRTCDVVLRVVNDVKQTTNLQRVVNVSLTLLLTSVEIMYSIYRDVYKVDSVFDKCAEASLLSLGLLPVLCKYSESPAHCKLSVAAIDLILKSFSTPTAWLPILQNHLQLQLIMHILQQHDRLNSVPVVFKFLLLLSRTKGGAQMLHKLNIFESLKALLTFFLKDEHYFLEGFSICNTIKEKEDLKHIWGLGLAISASMLCSLGDDITCTELVGNVIRYFFYEKASMMYYHLSFPKFPIDDHCKKKAKVQKSQTSLTALKETEYALMLACVLAKHQNVWVREMKEMDSELRETIIHMLAYISKGNQRIGDSPNKIPPLLCPPILQSEFASHKRESSIGSKHGWFTLAAIGSASQNKSPVISSAFSLEYAKKQANENSNFHRTSFSDSVAVQIYRIAFLLLKFLCTQARVATKRAEEMEYIDLAHFPELPMPEILHGLQDQSIAIITEICQDKGSKEIQHGSRVLCLLLLQILEKSLYLELCVSQSCGIRPVSGRVEDFTKEIEVMLQVIDEYPPFKGSTKSLKQIIAVIYPGIFQSTSIF